MKNKKLNAENLNTELQTIFNNDKAVTEYLDFYTYKTDKTYKIFKDGKVERYKSLLPNEYQEIEYIKSTGTSATYMILNVNPLSRIEQFEILFKDPVIIEDNRFHFFPVFGTNNANDTRVSYNMDTGYLTGSFGNMGYSASNEYIKNQINKISGESGKITINGKIFEVTIGTNANNKQYTGLFCVTGYGKNSPDPYYLKIKLYSLKFNRGNLLNLIPCYCTETVTNTESKQCPAGTIGMYDLANFEFYTNSGNGVFIKGPDV